MPVIGADVYICKSRVKWDGTNITISGVEYDPSAGPTGTKTFKVGKVGLAPQEIHKLDNIALLLDGWFVQRCEDANRLNYYPTQLTTYLSAAATETNTMLTELVQLQNAAVSSTPADLSNTISEKSSQISQQTAAAPAPTPAPGSASGKASGKAGGKGNGKGK